MVITAYAVIKLSSDVPGCNEEHTTLCHFFFPSFVFRPAICILYKQKILPHFLSWLPSSAYRRFRQCSSKGLLLMTYRMSLLILT